MKKETKIKLGYKPLPYKGNRVYRDKESGLFEVSLTMLIHTVGGADMAKAVFTNMVKSDPNYPLSNLEVRKAKKAELYES